MNNLLGFDPLLFLGINNLKREEKIVASKHLLSKISQYLLIRVSGLLSVDDLKSSNDPVRLFALAQNKIPNLNEKIKIFLANLKKDYLKILTNE